MTLDEIKDAWNAQADRFNQWGDLGLDEKVEWTETLVREACAKVCEDALRKHGVHSNFICAAEIRSGRHGVPAQVASTADLGDVLRAAAPAMLRVLQEINRRIQDHPLYQDLDEQGEEDVGGDAAEFSYMARLVRGVIEEATGGCRVEPDVTKGA